MPSLMDALGIALIAIGLALFILSIILDRRSSLPEAPDENGQEERVEREEHRE
jgi:hypothetical protein